VSHRAGFQAIFQKTGSIRAASIATGVTPNEHYRWIENNAAYRENSKYAQ
jgi:fido (protein-threonine AMPylation protein)